MTATNPIERNPYNQRMYLIRIYTLDTRIQKTFITWPILEYAIDKANQYGCLGTKMLLADDGCEICDNEAFLHYILNEAKFVVCTCTSQWRPLLQRTEWNCQTSLLHDSTANNAHNLSGTSAVGSLVSNDSSVVRSSVRARPLQELLLNSPASNNIKYEKLHEAATSKMHPVMTNTENSRPPNNMEYEIPWHKVPDSIMELLEQDKSLDCKMHTLAEVFVNELRNFTTDVPQWLFGFVAKSVVHRYPKSFPKPRSRSMVEQARLFATLMSKRHFLLKTNQC